ncbi:MAG: hypothetical protein JWP97_6725 [Labilithrix sp.]|nr:hypothetical protein [Labilithrix sp.]
MAEPTEEARARRDAALALASDEMGLESYYRDIVKPLLGQPREQWPRCCGGGCEPCAQMLIRVAERVLELLGEDEPPG